MLPFFAQGCSGLIKVSVGQKVNEGEVLILIDTSKSRPIEKEIPSINIDSNALNVELVVLGSGPGDYTTAFRAADLGINTIIVERYPTLGGVCLNVGCIPSKSLLHLTKIINEAKEVNEFGVSFSEPQALDRHASPLRPASNHLRHGFLKPLIPNYVMIPLGVLLIM